MNIKRNYNRILKVLGCSSLVIVSLAFSPTSNSYASSILSNLDITKSTIQTDKVINVSDEKRGMFGIFKKSDQESGASPLFLDNPKKSGSSRTTPHNFNKKDKSRGSSSRTASSSDMSTYERNLAKQEQSRAERKYAGLQNLRKVEAENEQVKAQTEKMVAQQAQGVTPASSQGNEVKKRYVYEPHKFNKNDLNNSRNNIFNSSR